MREKFQRLDSYELRTSLLFFQLAAICLAAFVVSINFSAMAFAQFPIVMFFVIALYQGARWYQLSYRNLPEYQVQEPQEENAIIGDDITADIALPQPTHNHDLEKHRRFYKFVCDVYSVGSLGEKTFMELGYSRGEYRDYTEYLKWAGVLVKQEEGKPYARRGNFQEALSRIEQTVEEETGQKNYWRLIGVEAVSPSPIPVNSYGRPQMNLN